MPDETKPELHDEAYDPATWLEDDEKLTLANLDAGAYKIIRHMPDGGEREVTIDAI